GVVEIFAMRGGAVHEGSAARTHRGSVADRRAGALLLPGCARPRHVVFVARGDAKPDHVDDEVFAFSADRRRRALGRHAGDARRKLFSDRRRRHHVLRRRPAPKPGMRLAKITTAKVISSMERPRTAMAPRSPLSFRSKMRTETTFVSEVNSMIAAESS